MAARSTTMTGASTPALGLLNQWWRVGGAAGIAFIVLFVVGAIVLQGDSPMSTDSSSEIREYYVDNGQRYLTGDFIAGLGFVFGFIPFVAALRALLARAEGAPAIWSRAALIGAVLGTVFGGVAAVFSGALALGAASTADDSTVQALVKLRDHGFSAVTLTFALFVIASALVIVRTGVLWRWLGWAGLVDGVALVVGSAWTIDGDPEGLLSFIGFIALIVLMLWVLAVSIAMLRLPGATPDDGAGVVQV